MNGRAGLALAALALLAPVLAPVPGVSPALAQAPPPAALEAGCDPGIREALAASAARGVEQDLAVIRNPDQGIRDPDSILDFSCLEDLFNYRAFNVLFDPAARSRKSSVSRSAGSARSRGTPTAAMSAARWTPRSIRPGCPGYRGCTACRGSIPTPGTATSCRTAGSTPNASAASWEVGNEYPRSLPHGLPCRHPCRGADRNVGGSARARPFAVRSDRQRPGRGEPRARRSHPRDRRHGSHHRRGSAPANGPALGLCGAKRQGGDRRARRSDQASGADRPRGRGNQGHARPPAHGQRLRRDHRPGRACRGTASGRKRLWASRGRGDGAYRGRPRRRARCRRRRRQRGPLREPDEHLLQRRAGRGGCRALPGRRCAPRRRPEGR